MTFYTELKNDERGKIFHRALLFSEGVGTLWKIFKDMTKIFHEAIFLFSKLIFKSDSSLHELAHGIISRQLPKQNFLSNCFNGRDESTRREKL
jgi:hypothetical protein